MLKKINALKAHVGMIASKLIPRVSFIWLALPVTVAVVAFVMIAKNMPVDYRSWWNVQKKLLEAMALMLIGGAFGLSAVRILVTRGALFSCWLSGLALVLWFREIHWDWMSTGVYVGLFFWMVFGCWKYARLENSLQNRRTMTLLALIFFSYAVAVTFDQQWWTETEFMDKAGKLAGECLENLGHVFVVLLVLVSPWKTTGRKVPESA